MNIKKTIGAILIYSALQGIADLYSTFFESVVSNGTTPKLLPKESDLVGRQDGW